MPPHDFFEQGQGLKYIEVYWEFDIGKVIWETEN